MSRQLGRDLVDPFGDDQHGAVDGLRQKVSERPVQTAGQYYPLAVLGNDGKRAIELKNRAGVTSEQPAPSFRFVARPESLGLL